LRETDQMYQI